MVLSVDRPEPQSGEGNGLEIGLNGENKAKDGSRSKVLTMESMSPGVQGLKHMDSIIRGPVIARAQEIIEELKQGSTKPFTQVITANIGDIHAMGQSPITYIRQMLAVVTFPELLQMAEFPSDVRKKAEQILAECKGGSIGSYSIPRGILYIRNLAAKYIQKRDNGIPSNPDHIFLSNGASDAIRVCLKLLQSKPGEKKAGVLVPIPQFPIFYATTLEYDMIPIEYYMDEPKGWATEVKELQRAVDQARKTCNPKAIVVVNPGNPTGSILTRDNMVEIIKFASREKLVILADEVYQDNVFGSQKFYSFKQVLKEMSYPYNTVELASFFSCSKGFAGECGLRGGYCELVNFDPEVVQMVMTSVVATKLCPTKLGQVAVACLTDPPVEGDPSFDLYQREKEAVNANLKERATFLQQRFSEIPGLQCQPIEASMYAFPRIFLPKKAITAAAARNLQPDEMYALDLLEETGICVVPGTAVGQAPGTYHFRTFLLIPMPQLEKMMNSLKKFHEDFIRRYE